jgi:beta-phosphoglucomutase
MSIDLHALIFDLDGVIAGTLYPHFLSWQRVAEEERVPFTYQDYERMLGLTRRQGLDILLKGRIVSEQEAQDWLRRKNDYFLDLLDKFDPSDIYPGVAELIAEARAAGMKVALGSSSQNARRVLEKLDLIHHFDVVGDGNTVNRHKPFPDIYLWVAAQLKIEPARGLIFEDSDVGIRAARAGGFWVVGVGPTATDQAHVVLPSLAGVRLQHLQAQLPLSNSAS